MLPFNSLEEFAEWLVMIKLNNTDAKSFCFIGGTPLRYMLFYVDNESEPEIESICIHQRIN